MKVLVTAASRLGSTEGIAARIAARLRTHDMVVAEMPIESAGELASYDAFVIGSALYAGHWLKEANAFVRDNAVTLSSRAVWLFSSGPLGTMATKVAPVEPAEVRELTTIVAARDHRIFAGAMDRAAVDGSELGLAARFIAKRFVPEGDFRDWPAIDAWADEIAQRLVPTPVG